MEQLEQTGWQPIATIPPIGDFLVYMPGERKKIVIMNNHPNFGVINGAFAFDYSTKPTHWQHLPQAPETTA